MSCLRPLTKIGIFIALALFFTFANAFAQETAEEAFNKGVDNFDQGSYEIAISDFTRAIEINPNLADAYNNRAAAYNYKSSYDQAIYDCNKAIELDPNSAQAYNNRIFAYYSKQDYDKAWDDVHKIEELGAKVKPEYLEELKKTSGREK